MEDIKYRQCSRCHKNVAENHYYERVNQRPMKSCKTCCNKERKYYIKKYQVHKELSDENKQYKDLLFKLLNLIDNNDDMNKLKSILV